MSRKCPTPFGSTSSRSLQTKSPKFSQAIAPYQPYPLLCSQRHCILRKADRIRHDHRHCLASNDVGICSNRAKDLLDRLSVAIASRLRMLTLQDNRVLPITCSKNRQTVRPFVPCLRRPAHIIAGDLELSKHPLFAGLRVVAFIPLAEILERTKPTRFNSINNRPNICWAILHRRAGL
jgi:hypothetical protein